MNKNALDAINNTLVHLFNEIWELEGEAVITEEYKDITNNDMHIIEAIGLDGDSTMSMVAKKMRITAGSLTTSINSLVKKGYVTRKRSEKDRRVVHIMLTEKGEKAYYHHKDFHVQMVSCATENMDDGEIQRLLDLLQHLTSFFNRYKEEHC
ncbi:MAG: MarR family winged helix-turn-helix transcriptional regulator [Lachnospiraceae bacterium]|nr:MarR family winged helix-turn-helix transcriptional regulator [Lachnospiraceae bacterium]MDY4969364.1 MarR family winged helix-turn-helix transcriptional regulator [Lachnospiraceae bacterium]